MLLVEPLGGSARPASVRDFKGIISQVCFGQTSIRIFCAFVLILIRNQVSKSKTIHPNQKPGF